MFVAYFQGKFELIQWNTLTWFLFVACFQYRFHLLHSEKHWLDFGIYSWFSRQIWLDLQVCFKTNMPCYTAKMHWLWNLLFVSRLDAQQIAYTLIFTVCFKTDMPWYTTNCIYFDIYCLFQDKYALMHCKLHILWYLLFVSRQICLDAQQCALTWLGGLTDAWCVFLPHADQCQLQRELEETMLALDHQMWVLFAFYIMFEVLCIVLCMLDRKTKCKTQCTQPC